MKIRRNNREETLQVTTERAPTIPAAIDLSDLRDRIMRQMPDIRSAISASQYGIRVDALTPQLREFFGVKADEGVLVASVAADSAAARAGLKAGEVITAVDGKRVSTPQDFIRQMRSTVRHAHNHSRQTGARTEARRRRPATHWTPPSASAVRKWMCSESTRPENPRSI